MIWTIFPQQPDISFESHFFGAACGVLAAVLFSRQDPKPPQKHYDWEGEDTDEDGDAGNPDNPGKSPH